MISKNKYNFWLYKTYNNLGGVDSFKTLVESEFEKVNTILESPKTSSIRETYIGTLKELYFELAEKKTKQITNLNKFVFWVLCSIFIGIIYYVGLQNSDEYGIPYTYLLLFSAFGLVVIWFVMFIKKAKESNAENYGYDLITLARDNNIYKKLKANDFPELTMELIEIAAKMEIEINKSNLYYDSRVKSSPAISKIVSNEKEEIFITLTRTSIIMFQENLHFFRAIYTHEFGHILQMDTRLWTSKLVPIEIYLPLIRLEMGDEDDSFSEFDDLDMEVDLEIDTDIDIEESIGQVGIPGLSLLLGPYLKKKQINAKKNIQTGFRYESENLADLCSVAYTESIEIIDVLKTHFNQEFHDENHPSTETRIISLKYHLLLAYYRFNKSSDNTQTISFNESN